jgi:hypothetical protein
MKSHCHSATSVGAPAHRSATQSLLTGKLDWHITLCLITILAVLSITPSAFAQDQARRLVALLDYLASDYKNAVQDGKVLSEDEYGEMQEFSKRSLELFTQLKGLDRPTRRASNPR